MLMNVISGVINCDLSVLCITWIQ